RRHVSADGVIEPFDQVHAAPQQLFIRNALLRPANQYPVEPKTFPLSEFLISQVGVVNDLRQCHDLWITDRELLAQGLECAVFSAMSKSTRLKHVEWNLVWMSFRVIAEDKFRVWIDESADEPGGGDSVDARARSR